MIRIRPIPCLAWMSLLCLWLSQQGLLGAEQNKRGREIFQNLCVKCHGRHGEGVKGEYDDALRGDWAIEKLVRYIDKNMPDDAPEKCQGPDAEAVARYIYDAFYSREARLRNHPPRVELVRLTNRQYLNTIADLLRHFTGSDGAAAGWSLTGKGSAGRWAGKSAGGRTGSACPASSPWPSCRGRRVWATPRRESTWAAGRAASISTRSPISSDTSPGATARRRAN